MCLSRDEQRCEFYRLAMMHEGKVEEEEQTTKKPRIKGPAAKDEELQMPKYILSYTKKKKICRIHVQGGCWRKPGVDLKDYELVYDLEDLPETTPFCKD